MPQNELDFERVIRALEAEGVRYLLVGGLAMIAHGSAHITEDVDLAYARDAENLERLVGALGQVNPRLRGAPADLPWALDIRALRGAANLTLTTDAGDVDLLGDTGVGSFEQLWERSRVFEIEGHQVPVVSLDDLIQMKRLAGRLKDRNHLLELEALRKLMNEA